MNVNKDKKHAFIFPNLSIDKIYLFSSKTKLKLDTWPCFLFFPDAASELPLLPISLQTKNVTFYTLSCQKCTPMNLFQFT